jgi:pimeloyl-ACP methyl ester carboxylesterase
MTVATRQFLNVNGRQVHLRRGGSGPAVVLLHATPRSSESLLDLIDSLAGRNTAIAIDVPGYGLSEPLDEPEIADYAAAVSAALDELGVQRFALYGEGSGACVALEVALAGGERCTGVIVKAPRVFSAGVTAAEIERHAPPLEPTMDGAHLIVHWGAVRDEFVFAPWWDRRPENRLELDLPDPEELHTILLERLRAGSRYAAGHWAASRYEPQEAIERLGPRAREIGAMTHEQLASALGALVPDTGEPPPPAARTPQRAGRQSKMYVDTPFGQTLVRFREEAGGRPVVLLHASPVSGFTLEGLVEGFAPHRPVYALDTIANGESDKPDLTVHPQFEQPSLADFAPWLIAVFDALGFDEVDVYGSHTGAMIALEAAIQAPERFANLVLDGVTMHDEQESEEIFSGYFADIRPKFQGAHLLTAWTAMQDVTLWHPWFVRDSDHISDFPVISARQVHEHAVEMLKRREWHERCYRPVYEYPTAERLPMLTPRTLIATPPDDYLERFSAEGASLAPNARPGTAPRSVTNTELRYAPFVPDAGVAEYYLAFFEGSDR